MNNIITQNPNKPTIRRTKVLKYNPETQLEIDARPILLLDVSGSMHQYVNNKRKIDILRETVANFTGVRMFVFSTYTNETKYIPEPQESTDLANAFRYLKSYINKDTNLVLVSDGEPNDSESALNEALSLHIPVNVVYIGNIGSSGEDFMKMLARITNGKEITVETFNKAFQQQLTDGIHGLLYGN